MINNSSRGDFLSWGISYGAEDRYNGGWFNHGITNFTDKYKLQEQERQQLNGGVDFKNV